MKKQISILVALTLSACSTPRHDSRTPAQENLSPFVQEVQSDSGRVDDLLPKALFPGESWNAGNKGPSTREEELKSFHADMADILATQIKLSSKTGGKDRVFHQKQHGCAIGVMHTLPLNARGAEHSEITNTGVFKEGQEYPVLIRFSNGVGTSERDILPDVRGVGIKIFGVKDEAAAQDDSQGSRTMDLTFTNSLVPFGKNHREFVQFMKAYNTPAHAGMASFAIKHPQATRALLTSAAPGKPLLGLRYYAGHPYWMGDRGAKFNIAFKNTHPVPESNEPVSSGDFSSFVRSAGIMSLQEAYYNRWLEKKIKETLSENYLSEDLQSHLKKSSYRVTLYAQLERNPKTTPIENTLHEWQEKDSPSIPVAVIDLPTQDTLDPSLSPVCHEARFTPGHLVSQHRPMGNMGRGRVFGYRASGYGRTNGKQEVSRAYIELKLRKLQTAGK